MNNALIITLINDPATGWNYTLRIRGEMQPLPDPGGFNTPEEALAAARAELEVTAWEDLQE